MTARRGPVPETLPPGMRRCGAAWHDGPAICEVRLFPPSARNGDYCAACMREYAQRRRAAARGEVAADVGPDYLALAESRLYPGRPYVALTRAERDAAVVLAMSLAAAAGAYPRAASAKAAA